MLGIHRTLAVGPMLSGIILTKGMVTRAGFEPVGVLQVRGIMRVA